MSSPITGAFRAVRSNLVDLPRVAGSLPRAGSVLLADVSWLPGFWVMRREPMPGR